LAHYAATREEILRRSADLFGWIAAGKVRVHVGLSYPLAEAAEAHRRLESRQTVGKILLIP
jgi:NADPH2:quinone reductase